MKRSPNRVIIERPLAGDFPRNQIYARWCMLDSLRRGEAPFASHSLYTQMLNDEDTEEREIGIDAGFAWAAGVARVYYVDLLPLSLNERQPFDVMAECIGEYVTFSRGMFRAWSTSGAGETRALALSNPDFWEAFLRGEEPKKTRGA